MDATSHPVVEGTRRDAILRLLREWTSASITDIAERFQVSEMTIRRDIQKLEETGQVIRIPGGVRIERAFGGERDFFERLHRMADAKRAIGKAAAALIQNGETITLDSGTTTLYIARSLRDHRDLTVFTFSLAVLEELAGSDEVKVQLTGGVYRRTSHDLIGRAVDVSLRSISTDRVLFGAAALSFRKGVMVFDREAPEALLESARERILVIDSSKIGQEATYSYCSFEQCDLIITDSGVKPDDRRRLEDMGKLVIAE